MEQRQCGEGIGVHDGTRYPATGGFRGQYGYVSSIGVVVVEQMMMRFCIRQACVCSRRWLRRLLFNNTPFLLSAMAI